MAVSNHNGVSSGEDAVRFNALVTSWPAIFRQAGSPGSVQPELES